MLDSIMKGSMDAIRELTLDELEAVAGGDADREPYQNPLPDPRPHLPTI